MWRLLPLLPSKAVWCSSVTKKMFLACPDLRLRSFTRSSTHLTVNPSPSSRPPPHPPNPTLSSSSDSIPSCSPLNHQTPFLQPFHFVLYSLRFYGTALSPLSWLLQSSFCPFSAIHISKSHQLLIPFKHISPYFHRALDFEHQIPGPVDLQIRVNSRLLRLTPFSASRDSCFGVVVPPICLPMAQVI